MHLCRSERLIWNRNRVIVAFDAADIMELTHAHWYQGTPWIYPSFAVGFLGFSDFSNIFSSHLSLTLLKEFQHCILWNPVILPMLHCPWAPRANPCLLQRFLSPILSQLLSLSNLWRLFKSANSKHNCITPSLSVHKILRPYPGSVSQILGPFPE